jgi:hypothetical protein
VEKAWRGCSHNDESTEERLAILEGRTGAELQKGKRRDPWKGVLERRDVRIRGTVL